MISPAEGQPTFEALQHKLIAQWPEMASPAEGPKTMVVVPSLSLDLPPDIAPLLPAYEERFLFLLFLLAQPRARVMYITAQPISQRIVDYYLSLVPSDRPAGELKERLGMVSIGDPATRPLTAKLLERPRTLARIRSLIPDPNTAHLVPFTTTELEVQLALELGIPMYGASPQVLRYGTKSGGRRIFREEGVMHPRGAEDLSSVADLVEAAERLLRSDKPPAQVVVKLDEGVGGFGNAIADLEGCHTDADIRQRILELKPTDDVYDAPTFLELFAAKGGVMEERVSGRESRSPSVQMRISPTGEVELLSTHDQILGGSGGQTYFGARFPADPAYAALIASEALKVGKRLAAEGVIGRFAVDFVVVATENGWSPFAIEINIRKGGTTHPYLTMQLLTNGSYDPETATFVCSSGPKHYVATDHLEGRGFSRLTADDLLDLAEEEGLRWDPDRQVGIVFHMISALPAAGRIGFTAIGSSSSEADIFSGRVEEILSRAATIS